jgi:hypothetical protein
MKLSQRLPALAVGLFLMATGPAVAETALSWSDQHDGGAAMTDVGNSLLVAPDGNLISGGESTDLIPGADVFIRKLDRATGSELWSVRQEGIDEKDLALTEMTWDSAGQLLVAAFIRGCIG